MERLTLTLGECWELLDCAGFAIGMKKLGAGLRQGIFPFGHAIELERSTEYVIYKKDVLDFIQAHSM